MVRVGMYPWSSEFPVGISSERVMEHREVWERLSPAQLGGFSGSGLAPTRILLGILLGILPGVLGHLTCPHRTPLHSWDTPSHSPTPFPNPISHSWDTPSHSPMPFWEHAQPFPNPIPQYHSPIPFLEHPQLLLNPISFPSDSPVPFPSHSFSTHVAKRPSPALGKTTQIFQISPKTPKFHLPNKEDSGSRNHLTS